MHRRPTSIVAQCVHDLIGDVSGVRLREIPYGGRRRPVIVYRAFLCGTLRALTTVSYPEIAKLMRTTRHTSVMNSEGIFTRTRNHRRFAAIVAMLADYRTGHRHRCYMPNWKRHAETIYLDELEAAEERRSYASRSGVEARKAVA